MKEIEWDKLNKINVRELSDAQTKHLVVKALVVQRLLLKYKSINRYIRTYTEVPIGNNKITDVYFENLKTREVVCYEIQSRVTPSWEKETVEIYKNFQPLNMTCDLVIIKLDEMSNNLDELKKQIDKIIL
jgi:hypothetical protein